MSITFVLDKCPPHVDERKVLQAVQFYADTLMPKFRRNITVTVEWSYSREFSPKLGRAEITFEEVSQHRLPTNFTIRLMAKLRGWRVYLYIAHEMIHLWQWATGRLRDCDDTHVIWCGNRMANVDEGMKYWDFPWEHEAMALEHGLYEKFKHRYGYEGKDLAAPRKIARGRR